MAYKTVIVAALGIIAAASPASATTREPPPGISPADSPDTRYCLRTEADTGSRIERIRCYTREDWALLGVDLDKEWPKEGVRIIRA